MTATAPQQTIHLQSLGKQAALPIEEVKPGALISWNYAWREYRAVSIVKVTQYFFELVEENVKTGERYTRRLRAGRLIAAVNP